MTDVQAAPPEPTVDQLIDRVAECAANVRDSKARLRQAERESDSAKAALSEWRSLLDKARKALSDALDEVQS